MTKKEDTYEQWLEKIKTTEPCLDNPEELTNDILNRIDALPSGNPSRILLLVSRISGIAAAFLLCFLISETVLFPQDKQFTEQPSTANVVWQGKASFLPDDWNTESSFLEKSRYLSEQWKEYKKELSKRKTFFLSKKISVENIIH